MFGFGAGEFGCLSFMMYHSHISFDILVMVLDICDGSRVCKLHACAFLFVVSTPDSGQGLLTQDVRRSLGGWWSGAFAILPR